MPKNLELAILIKAKDLASRALGTLNRTLRSVRATARRVTTGFRNLGARLLNLKTTILSSIAAWGLWRTAVDFTDTAATFEILQKRMEGIMGSLEGGQQATKWIKQFTRDTPFQLEQVTEGFIRLKAFGIDPTGGAYQAIADQAARLGGSQETLNGIILAVGQAWAKQKLQGEEILQLIERGVPVWQILADVTGKNVAELNKLSAAGKLGRDVIAALVEEMGRRASGEAAAQMKTWRGLVSNVTDAWRQLQATVLGGGLFDYLKDKLNEVLEVLQYVVASGLARKWGEQIADAVKDIGGWIERATKYITQFVAGISLFFNSFTLVVRKAASAIASFLSHVTRGYAGVLALLGKKELARKAIILSESLQQASKENARAAERDIEDIKRAWRTLTETQEKNSRSWKELVADAKKFNAQARATEAAAKTVGESMSEAAKRAAGLGTSIKANTAAMQAELAKQKEIAREFADLVAEMQGKKPGAAPEHVNLLDVGLQRSKAQAALDTGDYQAALEGARKAAELLRQLKEQGGEAGIVLTGMAKLIEAVGTAAAKAQTEGDQPIIDAQKQTRAVQDTLRQMQDLGAKGVDIRVGTDIDRTQLDELARTPISVPIRLNVVDGVPTYSDGTDTFAQEGAKRGYRP